MHSVLKKAFWCTGGVFIGTLYWKQASTVRKGFSTKNRVLGYGTHFRKRQKQPPATRDASSVRGTAPCYTECIFESAKNSLLLHRTHLECDWRHGIPNGMIVTLPTSGRLVILDPKNLKNQQTIKRVDQKGLPPLGGE